jgi:transcriptional regulator with XRE-family HTH domain
LRLSQYSHILRDMTILPTLIRRALKVGTPTMEDYARALGKSSSALRRYRLGNRAPTPEFCREFAQLLRSRARAMLAAADALDPIPHPKEKRHE